MGSVERSALGGARWLVGAFLALSLCSLAFLAPRLAFDRQDRYYLAVVDYAELRRDAEGVGATWDHVAERLGQAGVGAVAMSRLTLGELQAAGVLEILPDPEGTEFQGESRASLYLRLGPEAGAWRVAETLGHLTAVESRGRLLRILARGDVVLGAKLFWDRAAGAAFERRGLQLAHRLYNYAWSGNELSLDLLDGVAPGSLVLFDEKYALGWPDRLRPAAALLATRGCVIGDVEFAGQIGVSELVAQGKLRTLLVHSISEKELEKFDQERFLPRWVRAVRERRVRCIYLRPFPPANPSPGSGTVLDRDMAYFGDVVQALRREGFEPGRPADPTVAPLEPSSPLLAAGARAGLVSAVACLVAATLVLLGFLPPMAALLVGLTATFGLSLLLLVGKASLVWKTLALAAACLAPAAATVAFWRLTEGDEPRSPLAFALQTGPALLLFAAMNLAAGLAVRGFLGGPEFLAKADSFSGVKLVYLVPPALVCLWLLLEHRVRLADSRLTWLHVVLLGAVAAAGAVYVLRSGNFSPIPASDAELGFRDRLEQLLPARPRTKEFLVGYPALVLLALALRLGDRGKAGLLALAGCVAGVSVTNSFCHLASSPGQDVIRCVVGLVVGVPIGALLCPFLAAVRRLPGRSVIVVGWHGFGNAGDDLLLDRLVPVLREQLRPGDEIVVPARAAALAQLADRLGVKTVRRTCPFGLTPEFLRCRTVVFGGGGLFQDATSPLSVPYYAAFALAARLFSVPQRLFVAQGVGPLGNPVLRELTAFVARSMDYVEVRDDRSAAVLGGAGVPGVTLGTDLLWWRRPEEDGPLPARRALLGVALRPDPALDEAALGALARVLGRSAVEHDERLLLLGLQPSADRPVLERLARRLPPEASFEHGDVTSADLMRQVGSCRYLVCMRYHAALAAVATLTPFVGLSYDPKTEALFEELGWPHWLAVGEAAGDRLAEALSTLRGEGDGARERLVEARAELFRRGRASRERFTAALREPPACNLPGSGA